MFKCEISIIILICQKLGSVGPVQQRIKLSLPYGLFLKAPIKIAYQQCNPFQDNALFLYPLKTSENRGFLMFSGGKKIENWPEIGQERSCNRPISSIISGT